MKRTRSLALAVLALSGTAILCGCEQKTTPAAQSSPGGMPPSVAQEFNNRMQQGGMSASGPGQRTGSRNPAAVPGVPAAPAQMPMPPSR